MSESFLGDGLIFEEALPVGWTPGALAEGLALARLNADNHQLLGAESSLDEIRVHEALKDESPALVHELQRLEYKVNILLRLTAELALRNSGLPPAHRVRLTSRALEWFGDRHAGRRQQRTLGRLHQFGAAAAGEDSLRGRRRTNRRTTSASRRCVSAVSPRRWSSNSTNSFFVIIDAWSQARGSQAPSLE